MSIPMIYPAMQKLGEEIGSIGKTRKNPQQGYNFRGIDDCWYVCEVRISR